MRFLVVVTFLVRVVALVRMNQGGVIVTVAVVMRLMLKLAQRTTAVVVGDVVMIVDVSYGLVSVLLPLRLLSDSRLLCWIGVHGFLKRGCSIASQQWPCLDGSQRPNGRPLATLPARDRWGLVFPRVSGRI
jgi:hypothetical protein